MKGAFCKTDKSLTVSLAGKVYILAREDSRYDEVLELIRNDNWDAIPEVADMGARITRLSGGAVEVKNGIVYVEGEPLPSALSKTVIAFAEEKLDYQPLLRFWARLQANPSNSAVQRLYECLEVNHHPITENGCFLAYKAVRRGIDEHLYDIHTFKNGKGTFINDVGKVVSVPRNKVDENPDQCCSFGLHIASFAYAKDFRRSGDLLVEVEVDPAHVVAIPRSYSSQKMRVCQYKVVGINEDIQEIQETYVDTSKYYDYSDYDEEDYDEDYELDDDYGIYTE